MLDEGRKLFWHLNGFARKIGALFSPYRRFGGTSAMSATFKRWAASALAMLGLAVTDQASAATVVPAPAIILSTPGSNIASGGYVLGFQFSVLQNVMVTSLGVYDAGQDGLLGPAQVALWDTAGHLQVSATIPAGTGGTLSGLFRYVGVTPSFELLARSSYVVGAYLSSSGDLARQTYLNLPGTPSGNSGFLVDPRLSLSSNRFVLNSGTIAPSFPRTSDSTGFYYLGANFLMAPVPEPESYAMFALGLLAITAAARRRGRGMPAQ